MKTDIYIQERIN